MKNIVPGINFKMKPPNEKYKKTLIFALEALTHYADPQSYHAILIAGDPPCGWFDSDKDYNKAYKRPIHGKLARQTIKKINKILNLK